VFAEPSGILSVSFNPDGSLLATGDVDGKICLWRVVDGQQVLTLKDMPVGFGPSPSVPWQNASQLQS